MLSRLDRSSVPGQKAPAPEASEKPTQLKEALRGKSFGEQQQQLTPSGNVQQKEGKGGGDAAQVHAAAEAGTATQGGAMPYADQIQRAFGRHDIGGVRAHTGADASAAAQGIGAQAFARGNDVVFNGAPDLHTAAHEAAHTVQQRGGVQLAGGVGAAGDTYEKHADAVADKVVKGESAEGLLDTMAKGGGGAGGETKAVQRKNLQQADLAGGVAYDGRQPVMGQGFDGIVYSSDAAEAGDRTEALKNAATKSGEIGARVEGMGWTSDKRNLNKRDQSTMDPFHLRVTVPFKQGGKAETLSLTYQHAHAFMGYITAIKDSSNPGAKSEATMFTPKDKGGTGPLKGRNDKFSNVHDTKDNGNLAAMTQGGGEKNLDAYTKIGGEGARWDCVKAHASNLTNDSMFYSAHPTDSQQVVGITFKVLWLRWRDAFDRKYNVPDATVVKELGSRLSADKRVRRRDALTTKDYDLDNSRSWTAPVKKTEPVPEKVEDTTTEETSAPTKEKVDEVETTKTPTPEQKEDKTTPKNVWATRPQIPGLRTTEAPKKDEVPKTTPKKDEAPKTTPPPKVTTAPTKGPQQTQGTKKQPQNHRNSTPKKDGFKSVKKRKK